ARLEGEVAVRLGEARSPAELYRLGRARLDAFEPGLVLRGLRFEFGVALLELRDLGLERIQAVEHRIAGRGRRRVLERMGRCGGEGEKRSARDEQETHGHFSVWIRAARGLLPPRAAGRGPGRPDRRGAEGEDQRRALWKFRS